MKRYTHTKLSVTGEFSITTPNDRMLYCWKPLAIVRELNSLNDRLNKAKAKIEYLEEVRRDLAIRANGYQARCEILTERIQSK